MRIILSDDVKPSEAEQTAEHEPQYPLPYTLDQFESLVDPVDHPVGRSCGTTINLCTVQDYCGPCMQALTDHQWLQSDPPGWGIEQDPLLEDPADIRIIWETIQRAQHAEPVMSYDELSLPAEDCSAAMSSRCGPNSHNTNSQWVGHLQEKYQLGYCTTTIDSPHQHHYRASTITRHTVYFTKRTRHLRMLFLQFFLYWEYSFVCLLGSESEKIENNASLNVLCVFWSKQCVQLWWMPCTVSSALHLSL